MHRPSRTKSLEPAPTPFGGHGRASPGYPDHVARPCPSIGVAGTSPAMTRYFCARASKISPRRPRPIRMLSFARVKKRKHREDHMTLQHQAPSLGRVALVSTLLIGVSHAALAAETTYQRLLNARAEPQNWLMRMGGYDNWNYSPSTGSTRATSPTSRSSSWRRSAIPAGRAKAISISRRWSRTASCTSATSISNTGSSTSATRSRRSCGNTMPRCRAAARACTASRCSATTSISTPAATARTRG